MIEQGLTPKQKLFCNIYLSNSFNGVQAYCEAFSKSIENDYNNAKSSASQLLDKPQVRNYINDRLEENEITMECALAKLSFLIKQHSDLSVCHQAIKTYLKLNERLDDTVKLEMTYKANFS